MHCDIEPLRTVAWNDGKVRLIDQTVLPATFRYVDYTDWRQVSNAITTMVVRGAPAIGCTAALGLALVAQRSVSGSIASFRDEMRSAAEVLRASRPTAVNLFWAVDRIMALLEREMEQSNSSSNGNPLDHLKSAVLDEALAMLDEDVETNRRMGAFGADLLPQIGGVLTHCNAGALATVGFGTALGVFRAAVAAGKDIHVYADETRPRLQGMKLTAWELARDGIPVTIIADNMAASLMREGLIKCVVVGADRIASNGDTANKIGTYGVAVLAHHHGLPFYVAAPFSTIDVSMTSGDEIPIERRGDAEMTHVDGVRISPVGVPVMNPAFDVTPGNLVTAFITERGVLHPPFRLRDQVDPGT